MLIGISVAIAAYIASSTLRSIATITQTIMIMYLICFVIIIISGMGKGDLRHLLPVGTHGLGSILKDSLPAFWAYAGYELLLYVFPFVKCNKKKDILIAMSLANGFTTFFLRVDINHCDVQLQRRSIKIHSRADDIYSPKNSHGLSFKISIFYL
ncbi:GerAB/ArcD/ProY family transporter [Peribacillus frigoritolerans]|nr:GerAB/ArcD/ProY family transporter [Peribacillus frigoritolerans]